MIDQNMAAHVKSACLEAFTRIKVLTTDAEYMAILQRALVIGGMPNVMDQAHMRALAREYSIQVHRA